MTARFGFVSSINGSDEILGCKFLPLSRVHSIKDGVIRFFHVAHEEEMFCDRVCMVVN